MTLTAIILLLALAPAAVAAESGALPVAGWLERARLSPGEIVLEAKLDSGARTTSLHAENLKSFKRDGKDWVAFDVKGDDGRSVRIERPLVRVAQVRSAPGVEETRPSVRLGICIGNVYRVTEVNLVDRGTLSKPLLVGRRFLRNRLLIDMGRRNLLTPACPQKKVP